MATLDQQKNVLGANIRRAQQQGQSKDDIVDGLREAVKPVDAITTPNPDFNKPTIATTQNPVITRTGPEFTNQEASVDIPDFAPIDNLDKNGAQSYIDRLNYKAQQGSQLTEQEYMNLQRAIRKVSQPEVPSFGTNPADAAISRAESEKGFMQTRARNQASRQFSASSNAINSAEAQQIDAARESGERTKQAQQSVLSFSGFGRSTFAAQKQADIQAITNQNIEVAQNRAEAERAKAQAEMNNAPAEVLAGYDEYINALKTQSNEIQSGLITQMNEYNAQNTASYQEKVDNIMKLSMQFEAEQVPLTPEELIQVDSYATLAIDSKGDINESFLKNVPANMMGAVLNKAAEIKGAIVPESGDFGFINAGEGRIAVTDPITGEVRFEQGPVQKEFEFKDGKTYVVDPSTGKINQVDASVQGQSLVNFIKSKEGFRAEAYLDSAGVPTIGYGFTSIDDQPIQMGQTITQEEADVEFQKQLPRYQSRKNRIKVDLSPEQETALTSFEYNLGSGIWSTTGSDIISSINNGDLDAATKLLLAHNKAKDPQTGKLREVKGLVNRRNEEANMLGVIGGSGNEPETKFKNNEQSQAYTFARRISDSLDIVNSIEKDQFIGLTKGQLKRKLNRQKVLPNRRESDWSQQYKQGQRAFINSVLRKESGAAIAESEFDSARLQYFPQPGDSQSTIAQKAQARVATYEAMKKQSGNEDWFDWYDGNRSLDKSKSPITTTKGTEAIDAGF